MISSYYEFAYNFAKFLYESYNRAFPNDESGDLLMEITDQFFYDFDISLYWSAPGSSIWTLAHTHVTPYTVDINVLGLDNYYYNNQYEYDLALSRYNQINTFFEATPQTAPFFIPPTASNSTIELKTGGTSNTVFHYDYFWYNINTSQNDSKAADRNIKLAHYSGGHDYTCVNDTLRLKPIDGNISCVTNNRSYYNNYKGMLGNESEQTDYNGLSSTHSDNGICIFTNTKRSINDYITLLNTVVHEYEPYSPDLPSYPQIKHEETGEYYIGSLDSFDFDTQLPDVSLQSPDFTLLGSATSYLVDFFSDLSLTVPIIFAIISTVIIKNVKG